MKSIRNVLAVLVPVGVLGLAACATSDDTADDTTRDSNALGIARFATEDSGSVTTITGYDASGVEVGHVAIFHGTFTASPEFADDFSAPMVDGRTLSVTVGTQAYHWETEGYDPTLSLPAAPPSYVKMGTFLEEPQVVDVMKRWGIGFEHFVPAPATEPSLDGENPFALYCDDGAQVGIRGILHGSQTGTSGTMPPTPATTINLPNGTTSNTCGGSNPAIPATQLGLITTTINSVLQYVIFQECDLGEGTRLYRKACPVPSTVTGSCGTPPAGKTCAGCGHFTQYVGYEQDFPGDFGEGGHSQTVDSLLITNTGTTLNGYEKVATSCL